MFFISVRLALISVPQKGRCAENESSLTEQYPNLLALIRVSLNSASRVRNYFTATQHLSCFVVSQMSTRFDWLECFRRFFLCYGSKLTIEEAVCARTIRRMSFIEPLSIQTNFGC